MALGSPDVTKVNIELLRGRAISGDALVHQLEESLVLLEQAMAATTSFWEGDAAQLYRKVLRTELGDMRSSLAEFARYPQELAAYADRYEGVDRTAQLFADEIAQATWAEV